MYTYIYTYIQLNHFAIPLKITILKKKKFATFMNENCLSPYFLYKPDFPFPIYLNSLLHVQVILDSYSGEDVTGMKLKS